MPIPTVARGEPVNPALVEVARACLADGGALDEAARAVLDHTKSPIAAIKALMKAQPGLTLAEAKPLVHRNLSADARTAAEQLWADLARELAKNQDH